MRTRDPLGRFDRRLGRARIDCEDIPRLGTLAARLVLQDPFRRPHLVVWASDQDERAAAYLLRVEAIGEAEVILMGPDGLGIRVRLVRHAGPGNLLNLLYTCPMCGATRRFMYLARWMTPRCKSCAGLRWQSEGRHRARYLSTLVGAGSLSVEALVLDPRLARAALAVAFGPEDPWDPALIVSTPSMAAKVFHNIRVAEVGQALNPRQPAPATLMPLYTGKGAKGLDFPDASTDRAAQ